MMNSKSSGGFEMTMRMACLFVLSALLGVACGSESPTPLCETNLDCGECMFCVDGSCVPDLTCQAGCPDGCDLPPRSECVDGQILRSYFGQGICQETVCVFDFQDVVCSDACSNGVCIGEPCAGVVCDNPPGPCFSGTGICENGVCDYALLADGEQCDDMNACTEGDRCINSQCSGSPRVCAEPPPTSCKDSDTMQAYSSNGSCVAGGCVYPEHSIACSSGCTDGSCNENPCAGVVCDDPPSPCYGSAGSCASGVCNYPLANGAQCNDGDACTAADHCFNGVCSGGGLVCNNPPDNECLDANTMLSYSANGQCLGGSCGYDSQEVSCSHGCANGVCQQDACADVVCDDPPNSCFMNVGACANGSCFYPMLNGSACDDVDDCTVNDVCNQGTCAGTPKGCVEPTANHCLDGQTLRAYSSNGTCVSGTCDYPSQDVSCAFGCQDGFCVGDPCHGVVCETPPNTCFFQYGICSDGLCQYEALDGAQCDDSDSCSEGDSCLGGVCAGTPVACGNPPEAACLNANTLRVFGAVGACEDSSCSYPYQDVPCAEGCADGRCTTSSCDSLSLLASADVSQAHDASTRVAIAGNGPFAVVWEGDGPGYDANLMFRSVNADGTFGGSPRNLGVVDYGIHGLAFDGTMFGLAIYNYDGPVELWRIDAAGAVLGTTPLGAGADINYPYATAVWGNGEWAVAIDQSLARVSAAGSLVTPGTAEGYDVHPDLVWNGSEYASLFVGYGGSGGETYFKRFAADGTALGQVLTVGGAMCMDGCQSTPALVWTGSDYVALYVDMEGMLHRAHIVADGSAVTGDTLLGNVDGLFGGPDAAVYHSGRGELGLVYSRSTGSSPSHEVVFARVALNGDGSLLQEVRLSDGAGGAWLSTAGDDYVIAYTEDVMDGEGRKVRFARYGCGVDLP